MFTSVDSERKEITHLQNIDAEVSSEINDSSFPENKTSYIQHLMNFFSVNDSYVKLQFTVFCLTFILSLVFSLLTFFLISFSFGLSLFIGSIAGILYLRLLAKSVWNLSKTSSGISKVQLLLPICLFVFASKNELIDILPAIIGFFLYKPALIFYFSRS